MTDAAAAAVAAGGWGWMGASKRFVVKQDFLRFLFVISSLLL